MFKGLEIDFDMHRYLVLLFLIGILKAGGSSPYISPGIQFGITTNAKFFMSAQITFGYIDFYNQPPYGVTLGVRTYRTRPEKWEKFIYTDFQAWLLLGGIGVGKMIDTRNKNHYTRFKTGIGAFGYATYDYCKDFGNFKHNFGIIGTIPFYNILGGNYNPL